MSVALVFSSVVMRPIKVAVFLVSVFAVRISAAYLLGFSQVHWPLSSYSFDAVIQRTIHPLHVFPLNVSVRYIYLKQLAIFPHTYAIPFYCLLLCPAAMVRSTCCLRCFPLSYESSEAKAALCQQDTITTRPRTRTQPTYIYSRLAH